MSSHSTKKFASSSAASDYAEVMEQQLDDLRFHENRALLHRSFLTSLFGKRLADSLMSPDALPELFSLSKLAVEQGLDTLDREQLAIRLLNDQIALEKMELDNIRLQRTLDSVDDCLKQVAELQAKTDSLLEQKRARIGKQASKAASAQRQIEKDSLETKKFQSAADTLEVNLEALGFSDDLTHESLVESHLSNQHLTAEKRALLSSMAKFNGLSPDLGEARAQVEELEKEVARLQAEIQEQGRFLL